MSEIEIPWPNAAKGYTGNVMYKCEISQSVLEYLHKS